MEFGTEDLPHGPGLPKEPHGTDPCGAQGIPGPERVTSLLRKGGHHRNGEITGERHGGVVEHRGTSGGSALRGPPIPGQVEFGTPFPGLPPRWRDGLPLTGGLGPLRHAVTHARDGKKPHGLAPERGSGRVTGSGSAPARLPCPGRYPPPGPGNEGLARGAVRGGGLWVGARFAGRSPRRGPGGGHRPEPVCAPGRAGGGSRPGPCAGWGPNRPPGRAPTL